jgi:hypothetical protein
MKIRPVGAELLHAVGRIDGQTDVMQLIVAAPTIVLLAFSVFTCFILVSEQTGTLVLFNMKLLVFYIRVKCVCCAYLLGL